MFKKHIKLSEGFNILRRAQGNRTAERKRNMKEKKKKLCRLKGREKKSDRTESRYFHIIFLCALYVSLISFFVPDAIIVDVMDIKLLLCTIR